MVSIDISGPGSWLSPEGKVDKAAIMRRWRTANDMLRERKPVKATTLKKLQATIDRLNAAVQANRIAAWNTAIAILDQTEPRMRDIIERDFADVTGAHAYRTGEAILKMRDTIARITKLREAAFKKAFRHVRAKLGDDGIKEATGRDMAQWAKLLAVDDITRITQTIRLGLISGLDNTDIAGNVIGTMRFKGADGLTEGTRQRIIRLGRLTTKEVKRGKKNA